MNELALFAGAGGGILGGQLLGWRTVCAVELDAYAAQVLAQRQNDGILPPFPIWSDVRSFDGGCWRGLVDVVSGGFPCQDISIAGSGLGISGERSSLWKEMARIVGEVRPTFVFVENSPLLVRRGLAMVLGDLAELGYDARWCVVGAADLGAPHQRDRIWIVANTKLPGISERWRADATGSDTDIQKRIPGNEPQGGIQQKGTCLEPESNFLTQTLANSIGIRLETQWITPGLAPQGTFTRHTGKAVDVERMRRDWPTEPGVGRVADGVAARVDRVKALGNGQVPRVAAAAFALLAGDE